MNKDIELLEKVLVFLNKVPNRKYGDNYEMASSMDEYIKRRKDYNKYYSLEETLKGFIERNKVYELEETLKECKKVFKTLRNDSRMGIDGRWQPNPTDDSGFIAQIDSINEILKKIKNDTRNTKD